VYRTTNVNRKREPVGKTNENRRRVYSDPGDSRRRGAVSGNSNKSAHDNDNVVKQAASCRSVA
jgi:hypothetical protein